MKYFKLFAIICFCTFVVMSCNFSKNNGDSSLEDGEYVEEDTEDCDYCDGDGVIRVPCSNCNGTGKTDEYYYEKGIERITCSSCGGMGKFVCPHCHGTDRINCEHCSGRGVRTCDICKGSRVVSMPYVGNTVCPRCDGAGLIECFACNGKMIVNCGYCSDGKIMCEDCWGNGYHGVPTQDSGKRSVECEDCEGNKYFEEECPECDGEGEINIVKVYDRRTNKLIRKEKV